MSKIAVSIFLSALSLFGLEWRTYDLALIEQQKTHKPIMIDVIRTNCHYCEDMDEEVFEDKEMSKWLEERFISVKLNLDKDELPLGIKVMFTPTFYFVDNNKNIIKTIPGAWSVEDFKDLTRNIK